jgi:hypothetical protein
MACSLTLQHAEHDTRRLRLVNGEFGGCHVSGVLKCGHALREVLGLQQIHRMAQQLAAAHAAVTLFDRRPPTLVFWHHRETQTLCYTRHVLTTT